MQTPYRANNHAFVIAAGKLDRRIRIEEKVKTENTYGEELFTWQTLAECWAGKVERLGKEAFEADRLTASSSTTWQVRYRTDVKTEMRIVEISTGREYEILSTAEIGRKQGLYILTESEQP